MTRKKQIKKKVQIVFDPEKRREFLTGFSKRKNERRKRAREELERNVKEERKRIRQEIKDGMKHLKKSFEPLRELTEEDKVDGSAEQRNENEYEDDDVKVKIVELTTADLARQRNFLGENKEESSEDEAQKEEEDSDDEENNINCIPGMDFNVEDVRNRKRKTDEVEIDDNADVDDAAEDSGKKFRKRKLPTIESKRDLDRFTKKKMINKMKQSKVLRQKERFQKRSNQKQAKRERNNTLKNLPKNQRKKKKLESSRYRKGRLVNKKNLRKNKQSD